MKSNCLYDSEQKFKPILCKSQTKILSFSSVQKKKKKKKPTDRPNPKTMGRVTANKLFIKDGLVPIINCASHAPGSNLAMPRGSIVSMHRLSLVDSQLI